MATMRDDVPAPIRMLEPDGGASPVVPGAASPDGGASPVVPEPVRAAARRLLARDGRDVLLQPWQAAWLIATSEGREGVVPAACGVGRGWLQARLDEELARGE